MLRPGCCLPPPYQNFWLRACGVETFSSIWFGWPMKRTISSEKSSSASKKQTLQDQCRINNSSKCSNCYGLRTFGDPALICVKFVLLYMQGRILEFRCPRQTLRKGAIYILHVLYRNFIRWKQAKFFILSGILLLREIPFHIVNRLKSFGFKLLFVYTSKVCKGPFYHICI